MVYYISLFLTSFKYFFNFLTTYRLQESLLIFLLLFSASVLLIYLIRYLQKMPSKDSIEMQLSYYCFHYEFERYYSLFIVIISTIFVFSTLFYLRLNNITKTINLIEFKELLITIYTKYLFITIICNLILFICFIYLFLLIVKCFYKFYHKQLVMLHIYYLDKAFYIKCYSAFAFKYSLNAFIDWLTCTLYFRIIYYLALGDSTRNPLELTPEEEILVSAYNKKYHNYCKDAYIRIFFYNLHYTLIILFIFYDIWFNNYCIFYTFKYLPFMLLYQLYINLSNFVEEKTLSDTCADAHTIFYHDIIILDKKTMLVDGILSELPLNFPANFLFYEASGFKKYY